MASQYSRPANPPRTKMKPMSKGGAHGKPVRVIPLGGLGEIGMNMMIFEYDDIMFAVDCGQTLPEPDLLGVDLVIPDINYVLDNADKLRAVFLTHAHEDHIGALPFLLERVQVPVYGTALTCAFVKERLKEFRLENTTELNVVEPRGIVELGDIAVEFIQVTHSIPGAVALGIRLPFGNIIMTGDYKIDHRPLDGQPFDFATFSRYGEEGVLALFGDSTNVENEGTSASESSVIEPLDQIFKNANRTIVASCFSSALHRIQVMIDLAVRHKRKVFLGGFNMNRNVRTAERIGVLRIPPDTVFDLRDIRKTPADKRLLLVTGSQGEPRAALSKMALDEHPEVHIKSGDTVILSSRIIPGNERGIYRMINHLFKRGADVLYQNVAKVHASGHAYREEMRTMLALTRPKYLVPVHGEFRHQVEHKQLGVEMGIDPEKIFILTNGDVLEFSADGVSRAGHIPISRILVDGREVGGVDEVVLRDRKHLSEDGMVIAMMVIDQKTGDLVSGPDIVSRGFMYMDDNQEFFEECKKVVLDAFEACQQETREEWSAIKTEVRHALKRFIKSETGRFPVILPVILEI